MNNDAKTSHKYYVPFVSSNNHDDASDAFHILEVNIWTQGPKLADIGTFVVPLLTYLLLKTHINGYNTTAWTKTLCVGYVILKIYIMIG